MASNPPAAALPQALTWHGVVSSATASWVGENVRAVGLGQPWGGTVRRGLPPRALCWSHLLL